MCVGVVVVVVRCGAETCKVIAEGEEAVPEPAGPRTECPVAAGFCYLTAVSSQIKAKCNKYLEINLFHVT